MSTDYTPVATALPATIPMPDDNDLESAASQNVPDQALANALKRLEQNYPTRMFREVVNIGALAALTDHTNGEYVFVTGIGLLYRYDSSSAATVTTYGVVKPSDVSGNGRWINGLLTAGAGYAELLPGPLAVSTGKMPVAQIVHGIVTKSHLTTGVATFGPSATTTLATGSGTFATGDIVTVQGAFRFTGGVTLQTLLECVGAGVLSDGITYAFDAIAGATWVAFYAQIVASGAGAGSVAIKGHDTSGNTITVAGFHACLEATRP